MQDGIDRRTVIGGAAAAMLAGGSWPALAAEPVVEIRVDTRKTIGTLAHIWEECVGSDRAAITLRESWRRDLDRWVAETGVKRVRFHGILNDELGVYAPSILSRGKAVPNFQRIDQVYDGLIDRGVDPLVELSFMPKALASGTRTTPFTYGGNITPPKLASEWGAFITAFVEHLVNRYGIATVRRWPFEIWNEPNLPTFWAGTQAQYFEMYKAAAVAIKTVDPAIRIGGPATATTGWLVEFADYCATNNAPVDFFTTHIYAGDSQKELFPGAPPIPQNDVIPTAIAHARRQIDASKYAGHPLWITEWSSDSPAMIGHVMANCLPYCQAMSHWALSAEFEELGYPDYLLKEGDSGWGLMSAGIAKPAFNTYKLLHRLGHDRLAASGPCLASRRQDKSVAAFLWNLAEVTQPSGVPGLAPVRKVTGSSKRYAVEFAGARAGQAVSIRYVDQERGSPMPAWRRMGSPQYPSQAQIALLRRAADIAPATRGRLDAAGRVTIDLPPEGVALVELL